MLLAGLGAQSFCLPFFWNRRGNLTWAFVLSALFAISGIFSFNARAQGQVQQLEIGVTPIYSRLKEATSWGYPATGFGLGGWLRYTSAAKGFPFLLEANAQSVTAQQKGLKGLKYRGEDIFQTQRFGLSYADIQSSSIELKALWMPASEDEEVGSTFQWRLGLLGGITKNAWLHPVTNTRVFVVRPYFSPALGFATSRLRYPRWLRRGALRTHSWLDVMPVTLSSATRTTSEGNSMQEDPLRLAWPSNGFGYQGEYGIAYRAESGFGAGASFQTGLRALSGYYSSFRLDILLGLTVSYSFTPLPARPE